MKTFEDAYAIAQPTSDKLDWIKNGKPELFKRYEALVQEVQTNPKFKQHTVTWVTYVATGVLDPFAMVMSVFLSGLITGIEMERMELDSASLEPKEQL